MDYQQAARCGAWLQTVVIRPEPMTLKLNDPPELATPAKPDSAPVNSGSVPAQSSRSNPVCLEVPVTVRRLPSVEQSGATSLAKPVPEEARTVIVFENGAVLRLASTLPAGTPVTLTNSRGREVVCRVASARNLPAIKGYVEVKFEEAANDFWGLQPGEPPTRTSAPAAPATIAAPPAANAPARTPGVASPRPVAAPPPEKAQRNAPFESIAGQVPMSPPLVEARKLSEPEPRPLAQGNRVESARVLSQPPRIGASSNKTNTIQFADEIGLTSAARNGPTLPGLKPSAASSREFFGGDKFVSGPGPTPSTANGSHRKMLLVLGTLAGGLALASVGFFFVRRSNVASPVPPPHAVSQQFVPAPPPSPETDAVQPAAAPQDVSLVPASPAAPTAPAVPDPPEPAVVSPGPQAVHQSAGVEDAKPPARPVAPKRTISNFNLSAPASARANASRRLRPHWEACCRVSRAQTINRHRLRPYGTR
jgi:hypothetical protein